MIALFCRNGGQLSMASVAMLKSLESCHKVILEGAPACAVPGISQQSLATLYAAACCPLRAADPSVHCQPSTANPRHVLACVLVPNCCTLMCSVGENQDCGCR